MMHTQSTSRALLTSRVFDPLGREQEIVATPAASGQKPFLFEYTYNLADQKKSVRAADESSWKFDYDPTGRVHKARKTLLDREALAGTHLEYNSDGSGNQLSSKTGGNPDSSAASLLKSVQ